VRYVLLEERLPTFHDGSVAWVQLRKRGLAIGTEVEKMLQRRHVLRKILKHRCSLTKDRVECEERLVLLQMETNRVVGVTGGVNDASDRAVRTILSRQDELLPFFESMETVDLWGTTQATRRGRHRNEILSDFVQGSVKECVPSIWRPGGRRKFMEARRCVNFVRMWRYMTAPQLLEERQHAVKPSVVIWVLVRDYHVGYVRAI